MAVSPDTDAEQIHSPQLGKITEPLTRTASRAAMGVQKGVDRKRARPAPPLAKHARSALDWTGPKPQTGPKTAKIAGRVGPVATTGRVARARRGVGPVASAYHSLPAAPPIPGQVHARRAFPGTSPLPAKLIAY